jgi:KTSC domain
MPPELLDELIAALEEMKANGEELSDEMAHTIADALEGFLEKTPSPSIPSGADLVWILSGSNPNVFAQYLKTIPDPALNELSRNPSELNRVIHDLSQKITTPSGEVQDGIPKSDLQSSNVYGFAYNPRDQSLFVRFNNGGIYEYGDVPPSIFKIFARGAVPARTTGQNQWGKWWRGKFPSLGAAFYQMIREGGFPYQKVA